MAEREQAQVWRARNDWFEASAKDDSTAATLFDMLDSNHNGVISKMELIDFCSTQSVSNAKLTKALGLSGKYQVTRSEFYAAHRSGAIDFLNGIADIGLTRRNSQMESLGAGVQQMAAAQQPLLVFSSFRDNLVAVSEGGALVTNTSDDTAGAISTPLPPGGAAKVTVAEGDGWIMIGAVARARLADGEDHALYDPTHSGWHGGNPGCVMIAGSWDGNNGRGGWPGNEDGWKTGDSAVLRVHGGCLEMKHSRHGALSVPLAAVPGPWHLHVNTAVIGDAVRISAISTAEFSSA